MARVKPGRVRVSTYTESTCDFLFFALLAGCRLGSLGGSVGLLGKIFSKAQHTFHLAAHPQQVSEKAVLPALGE